MNILFTTGVFPPAIGGPGKIVAALATALSSQGHVCAVLTFGKDDATDRPYAVSRIPFSIPQPLRLLVVMMRTLRMAANVDAIYSLDTYSNGCAAAIASRLLKKPLIQRFSGDSVWESAYNSGTTNDDITAFQNRNHGLWTKILIWRRNFILRTARPIITDSEFLKNFLKTIGIDENRVQVVRNPVILERSDRIPADINKETFKQEHSLKQNVILTMARLVPWKGVGALIQSMPDVLHSHPNTTLAIAGTGPMQEELKKLAVDAGLRDCVVFLGNVKGDKKRRYFAASDVFCLNTFYESMSNALLEAMAASLPVVTTNAGGNPEFVNNANGMLVRYNNTSEIAQAIIALLDNAQLRQKLGEQARRTVQQFTLENFVNQNLRAINDCAGKAEHTH